MRICQGFELREKRKWQLHGFSKIKETCCETVFILPVLKTLTSFSKNKIHVLFLLHLHNFQQGFPNKHCLSCLYPPTLHPSRSTAASSSIKACPVFLSGIETGTGRWSGTGGLKVMSEERHRVTVCQGFVCSMWQGKTWRRRWMGREKTEAKKTWPAWITELCLHCFSRHMTLSTQQILTTCMYIYVCVYVCIFGPGASGGSSSSWVPDRGSDWGIGDLERLRSRSNRPTNKNNFST